MKMEAKPENPVKPQNQEQSSSISNSLQRRQFPTYLTVTNISSNARLICDILTRASPLDIDAALHCTGINPTSEEVEEVLRLSYNQPSSARKFFRWVSCTAKPSALAWNLMVDLLGKNQLFDPMWDAIRSMKEEGLLSVWTFGSIFSSYCAANRFNDAVIGFHLMEKYGIQPDVVAVNSLLSASCLQGNQVMSALDFFDSIKVKIPPDGDSFAILLEACQKEGNVAKARIIFGEMVVKLGWNPTNTFAHDAFLTTLICEAQANEALKFLKVMKGNNCLPSLRFFFNALDILVKRKDLTHVMLLWDILLDARLIPNLIMYNSVIGLLCDNNDVRSAFRFLDGMVFDGAFPDSLTYNMIFQCLVRNKRVREVESFFFEMVKNESPPTNANCAAAIEMFLKKNDPEMAIEIWNYMMENHVVPLEVSANALLVGLQNLRRLSDVRRFAEDMLHKKINIMESTMEKLKKAFYNEGTSFRDKYDSLSRRWKAVQM